MDRTKGFGVNLDKTLKKIQQVYVKEFERNHINITIEQWVILQKISQLGKDATQASIVQSNYRNRATTSRLISALCEKGMIIKKRKSDYPNRFKLLLTQKGSELINKATPIVENLRIIAYNDIRKKDFEVFLEVLDKLWNNYDKYFD
ncbi:MAG: MarR family winged helix-turn-helix transcriptional regulator [Flavobacteriaceae bacterium]